MIGYALQSQPEIPTDLPRTDPPITSDTVSLLMDDVVSFLGADKLITPDDLRGDYNSLREALIDLGPEQFWPDVDDVRGKVLIIGGGAALHLSCAHSCPRCSTCIDSCVNVCKHACSTFSMVLLCHSNECGCF